MITILVGRERVALLFGGLTIDPEPAGDHLVATTLVTGAVGAVIRVLTESGVPFTREDSTVRVAPAHTGGMILEFVGG